MDFKRAPKPDLARCTAYDAATGSAGCGWSGKVDECDTIQEGDRESGYVTVDVCPKCGGEIEYEMSEQCAAEWHAWFDEQKRKETTNAE